ncbi:TetR/AcrR family transcriptional regulator [Treponema sp. HNW]|uniref:TetR/AcrR family transcriptional regulator n=1 Tax=Treponema sp. HNW TaxID=3116654 RepID=UPI003D099BF1
MNKNEIASFQTKNKILMVAKQKFIAKGYNNTSLQEIVEEIGLTRGAFYHHFKNKEEILSELIRIIQNELADYVEKTAMQSTDRWEQLIIGCVAFVEKAIDKDTIKILLLDGPSVLSWQEWKRMDTENSESRLKELLLILQEEGIIKKVHIDYLTSFISGGLNELAIKLSRSQSFDIAEIESSIRMMLEGIRKYG